MIIKELIEFLKLYPLDTKIWVSDKGYCEGAIPLETVELKLAYEADLDGDLVDDEWLTVDSNQIPNYEHSHRIIHEEDGDFVASKYVLLLNNEE
jgi:hypothetical protein